MTWPAAGVVRPDVEVPVAEAAESALRLQSWGDGATDLPLRGWKLDSMPRIYSNRGIVLDKDHSMWGRHVQWEGALVEAVW